MFCIQCGKEMVSDINTMQLDPMYELFVCSDECKEEHKRRQNTLDELTQMSQEMGMYD